MTHSLTIGLLSPAWPGFETPNGIATSVYHLARGLTATGHAPVIVTPRIDAAVPEDIPVVTAEQPRWTLGQKIADRLGRRGDVGAAAIGRSLADAAVRAHRQHRIDVFLAEETQGWAYWIARRLGVPVVIVLHGPWILHEDMQDGGQPANQGRAAREQRAFRTASAILAPSRNVLDAVAQSGAIAGLPQAVIPNAYDPPLADAVAKPPGKGTKPDILFVGRYDRHKGGDTALEAFARLAGKRDDVRMTFAGPDRGIVQADGSVRHLNEALAGVSDAVRSRLSVPGRQSASEIARHRGTHRIALIASRYENLNYTMLEAMAAGQAIVATSVGGLAEVLAHEQTALLVPPDDPAAMAAALERLVDDPDLATRLGQAAQAKLRADFHPGTIARATVEFLRAHRIVG